MTRYLTHIVGLRWITYGIPLVETIPVYRSHWASSSGAACANKGGGGRPKKRRVTFFNDQRYSSPQRRLRFTRYASFIGIGCAEIDRAATTYVVIVALISSGHITGIHSISLFPAKIARLSRAPNMPRRARPEAICMLFKFQAKTKNNRRPGAHTYATTYASSRSPLRKCGIVGVLVFPGEICCSA